MTTYYVGVRICKTDTPSIGVGTREKFIGNGLRCTILGGKGLGSLSIYDGYEEAFDDVVRMSSTHGTMDNTYHVLTIELEE